MEHNLGSKNMNLQDAASLKIDKSWFLVVYNKYKSFLLPLVVLVVSVIILFLIVIPEINQYFSSRNQLSQETQKLDYLKNNYNFLANIDETQSNSDLQLLEKTLPAKKDLLGIMTAISATSSKVGISIDDFKFTLGNLSKASSSNSTIFPNIAMELTTEGNAILLNEFMNELYKTAPLVEVYGIKYGANTATLLLRFYYKPFSPQNINDESPISQLSPKEKALLKDIYSWNNLTVENGLFVSDANLIASASASIDLTATSSAQTTYSPF
jgi:hypothetical protein